MEMNHLFEMLRVIFGMVVGGFMISYVTRAIFSEWTKYKDHERADSAKVISKIFEQMEEIINKVLDEEKKNRMIDFRDYKKGVEEFEE